MNKKYSNKEIRDFISCPQFGDNKYGKWGSLNFEIRKTIYDLLELNVDYDNLIYQLQSNWNSLREWLEKQISNDLDGIFSYSGRQCKETLDKMNELEGKDK